MQDLLDKKTWPQGTWTDELDELVWIDEATNLACHIVRGPVGALCGYVGVPEGHPMFNVPYENVDVDVHGGLTYSRLRDDGLWWLGFDCAHYDDIAPGMMQFGLRDGTYKDFEYVKQEVTSLVAQLNNMKGS